MHLQITRKTGFYGTATPINIIKNGEFWLAIANNTTKSVRFSDEKAVIQARFFFLRSNQVVLMEETGVAEIEIVMNPLIYWSYLFFFLLSYLLVALNAPLILSIAFICCFFIYLLFMHKKAYIIKEKSNGT